MPGPWWRALLPATRPPITRPEPAPTEDTGLQVLLVEYETLRDDERSTASSQATLASVFVALLAGLFAIMVGDCRFRGVKTVLDEGAGKESPGCYALDEPVYLVAPALPLAVLTYIVMLGLQITIKSFYMRAVENEIRKRVPDPLETIPSVTAASATELLLAVTSPRRGQGGYRVMLFFLSFSFVIALGGWMTFVALQLSWVSTMLLAVFYGPLLLLLVWEGFVGNTGGRGLLGRAVAHLAASPEYPSLRAIASPPPPPRTGLVQLEGRPALLARHGDHPEQRRGPGQHPAVGHNMTL